MKTYKKDIIKIIMKNEANRQFFKASGVLGDKGYSILTVNGQQIFAVKTSHGMAYYELNGSIIGNYNSLV